MKKRIAALLLVVCTLLGCLSGCGKKDEPSKELEPGEIPTITVGLKQNANVSDYETNEFTLWIEEQLGVNLEFMLLSSNNSEAVQQISLMMAGGEKLPDIIWGLTLSKTAIMEYGEDGYLVYKCVYDCVDEEGNAVTTTEPVAATGEHTFEDAYKEATCTEPEMAGLICKDCGATEGEMEITGEALCHDYAFVPECDCEEDEECEHECVEPTCTKPGFGTTKCTRCAFVRSYVSLILSISE